MLPSPRIASESCALDSHSEVRLRTDWLRQSSGEIRTSRQLQGGWVPQELCCFRETSLCACVCTSGTTVVQSWRQRRSGSSGEVTGACRWVGISYGDHQSNKAASPLRVRGELFLSKMAMSSCRSTERDKRRYLRGLGVCHLSHSSYRHSEAQWDKIGPGSIQEQCYWSIATRQPALTIEGDPKAAFLYPCPAVVPSGYRHPVCFYLLLC